MNSFRIPPVIMHGSNSLDYLSELQGTKALLITGGSSMKKGGFLEQARKLLEKAGMQTNLLEGVEPDPSVKTVMNGAKIMQDFQPDWIVAIGGGSAIDAAKAMWVFYEHPQLSFPDIVDPFSIPRLRNKAKFAAIPSTSGTATEVTAFSVITDTDTANMMKYPLVSYEIIPDVAILDPNLVMTMPTHIVAHTGMDALTHAIEAFVSTASNDFTDPLALKAITLINGSLLSSFQTSDPQARSTMHYAQCLAGMAFSNALLGITHSMAHKIGAQFHVPHGEANAILLPYVIEYNAQTAADRYAVIASAMGIEAPDSHTAVTRLIAAIKQMNQRLNIPITLAGAEVPKQEFSDHLSATAQNALEDPCTGSNPRKPTAKDIEGIYMKAFNG